MTAEVVRRATYQDVLDAPAGHVYRRDDVAWTRVAIHHGDVVVRAEPFDAVELPLGRLWEL